MDKQLILVFISIEVLKRFVNHTQFVETGYKIRKSLVLLPDKVQKFLADK